MNTSAAGKYKILFILSMVMVLIFIVTGDLSSRVYAQGIPTDTPASEAGKAEGTTIEVVNPYFSIEHRTSANGIDESVYIINGPPEPLPEFNADRIASMMPTVGAAILPDFPSYKWVFGCSAVSGAMIAGYYDRGAYPNMYTGSVNGGVMPLTDTSWPRWNDGYKEYPNNPLIASHNGVDGRTERGSIDDYWVKYQSTASDPYISGGWAQHIWGTAIGDYMKTSRSAAPYYNEDGGTKFVNYTDYNAKYTCSYMETRGFAEVDGTYGRKLFYEARGYSVSECYNQKTDNTITGGFSLANFQAEIDAGNPVLLNLYGHSIVGYGYNGSTIYIRDTWDNDPSHVYKMPWGGKYQNMELFSVSVVHLQPSQPAVRHPLVLNVLIVLTNKAPTNIILSKSSIAEGQPINTIVGTLSSIDPNVGDTFTYNLVPGAGDTGNGSFNISGNQLRSSAVFDYEIKNSYSVRIRTTDKRGLYFEKAFTITITTAAQNHSPTDIILSNNSLAEGQPINSVVGAFSTIDPDVGDTFTYNLVPGAGDTGNGSFNISGNQLRSSAVFDYETQNSYSIRVSTTDQAGLFFEKAFTITITMAGMDPIDNGDFEQGPVAWTEYSTNGWELILQVYPGGLPPGFQPYDGTWAAWLGGLLDETAYIQQQVLIPPSLSYMSYWHWIASEDVCGYDFGSVLINGVAVEEYSLCADNETNGWVKRVVNLNAYAGQSVSIQIRAECDGSMNSNLFIDHVAFQATPTVENPPSAPGIGNNARPLKTEVLRK